MPFDRIVTWFRGKPCASSNVYDLTAHLAARAEGRDEYDLTSHMRKRQNHEMVSSTCVRMKRKAHNLRVIG